MIFYHHYHLYLTSQCNQNCLFCLVKNKPDSNFTLEQIKKLLKRIKQKGVRHISIDGGEPTLFKNFILLLKEIQKLQFKTIHLKTNGVKFSDKLFVKQFFQLQLSSLTTIFLSLHSYRADIHDYLVHKKGSFHQVIKAINNILENHGRLIINCVVCKTNYQELDKFIQFLKKIGITEVNFLFIAPLGNALHHTFLIPDLQDVMPYCKKAVDTAIKLKIHPSLTFFPFCVLGKYKKYAVEYYIPTNLDSFSEDYSLKHNFISCQQCKYFAKCPKIWEHYFTLYKFTPKIFKK